MLSRLFTIQWKLFLFAAVFSRAVPAADWPQFHGPNRDNKSADTGRLKAWPEGGPPRLWEASGIGQGYSSVAIAAGRVYVTGEIDGDCVLTAFGLNGNQLWTRTNGAAWSGSYTGTRSTPTIADDGLLYHLSGIGNLVCLKADTGQPVWSVNILQEFAGRNITWGLAESPLVVDDLVICTPGGKEISMVALDRHSGRAVWKCTGAGDKPGYASPILVEYHGLRQIITAMSESYAAVRASYGQLLWRYPFKVYADENIVTPIVHDGFVIISGCVKNGTSSLRLLVDGDRCSVEEAWHNDRLDNKQGGIVLVNGRLYGYAELASRGVPWVCVDARSGKTVFQSAPLKSTYKYKSGSLTYADGRFYLYSDNGNMALAKATDRGLEVTGRLRIETPGERPTWAHSVVCGGRLYVRYGDRLGVHGVADVGSRP